MSGKTVNIAGAIQSLGLGRGVLPFNGPLGDERHGVITIASPATATEVLFQAQNVIISAVWTMKQQNPGGLLLAVTGRLTIQNGGVIDADFLGAPSAGAAIGAPGGIGRVGYPGAGFAGSGGGGGTATNGSGRGGPVFAQYPLGIGAGYGGTQIATNTWEADPGAATFGSGVSDTNRIITRGGASDNNGNTFANQPQGASAFDLMIALNPGLILGWGSSGGGGAANNSTTGGAAGVSGKGGGCVVIVCNELDFQAGATIRARGQAGTNSAVTGAGSAGGGGGGGGGGQIILLYRTLIANAGTIQVTGGAGGNGNGGGVAGGTGGDGFSKVALYRW